MSVTVIDAEMFRHAQKYAEAGIKELQIRISNCYRDGRGVERDLEKAADWMNPDGENKPWRCRKGPGN